MNDRLTAFLDILGFKDEIKTADENRLVALTSLLRELSRSEVIRGDDRVVELGVGGGETRLACEATVFSDSVVISYLKSDLKKHSHGNEITYGLISLEQRIQKFAADAAVMGLLVRGGIAVGPLDHETDGVVVGQAMVDAYRLESEVAHYPRIVVSRDVYSAVKNPQGMLLRDHDGIVHFNYFDALCCDARLGTLRQEVTDKIALLQQENKDLRKLAKWAWFKKHLDMAYSEELPYY